jgi:hypothetical protein
MRHVVAILLTLILLVCAAQGADSTRVKPATPDTIVYVPTLDSSAALRVTNPTNFEEHLTQNPTTALFKSMFVPGLGQIGNHRYIKAAAIIGVQTWFVGSAIHYGSQASDYKAKFEATPITEVTTRNHWHALYADRRSERNKYIWFAGLVTFVSMFDAYVDAHLSGSPEQHKREHPQKEGLSFDFTPPAGTTIGATLAYRF